MKGCNLRVAALFCVRTFRAWRTMFASLGLPVPSARFHRPRFVLGGLLRLTQRADALTQSQSRQPMTLDSHQPSQAVSKDSTRRSR